MIKRYPLIFWLFLPTLCLAQNNFQLTGYVRDTADRPLVGAVVLVLDVGYGTTTDSLGFYIVKIPKGLQTIHRVEKNRFAIS